MKVRYSPKVDADLQVAFTAQSCRAVAADVLAKKKADPASWKQTAEEADRLAETIFPAYMGESTSAEALDQMIEYEMYKATELYLLFAQEAKRDGFPEIAQKFEEAAKTAEKRWKALEALKESMTK